MQKKSGEISLAKWLDGGMGSRQISLHIADVELEAAPDVFLVSIIKNPFVRSAPDSSDALLPALSRSFVVRFLL